MSSPLPTTKVEGEGLNAQVTIPPPPNSGSLSDGDALPMSTSGGDGSTPTPQHRPSTSVFDASGRTSNNNVATSIKPNKLRARRGSRARPLGEEGETGAEHNRDKRIGRGSLRRRPSTQAQGTNENPGSSTTNPQRNSGVTAPRLSTQNVNAQEQPSEKAQENVKDKLSKVAELGPENDPEDDADTTGQSEAILLAIQGLAPWRLALLRFWKLWYVQTVMFFFTVYALFGDDIRILVAPRSADNIFHAISFVYITLFFAELISLCLAKPRYLFSFYFFIDLIATLSLLIDIPWVWDPIAGTSSMEEQETAQLLQPWAGRISAASARAGRVVRLLRLVRIVQVYRACRRINTINPIVALKSLADEMNEEERTHYVRQFGAFSSNQKVVREAYIARNSAVVNNRMSMIGGNNYHPSDNNPRMKRNDINKYTVRLSTLGMPPAFSSNNNNNNSNNNNIRQPVSTSASTLTSSSFRVFDGSLRNRMSLSTPGGSYQSRSGTNRGGRSNGGEVELGHLYTAGSPTSKGSAGYDQEEDVYSEGRRESAIELNALVSTSSSPRHDKSGTSSHPVSPISSPTAQPSSRLLSPFSPSEGTASANPTSHGPLPPPPQLPIIPPPPETAPPERTLRNSLSMMGGGEGGGRGEGGGGGEVRDSFTRKPVTIRYDHDEVMMTDNTGAGSGGPSGTPRSSSSSSSAFPMGGLVNSFSNLSSLAHTRGGLAGLHLKLPPALASTTGSGSLSISGSGAGGHSARSSIHPPPPSHPHPLSSSHSNVGSGAGGGGGAGAGGGGDPRRTLLERQASVLQTKAKEKAERQHEKVTRDREKRKEVAENAENSVIGKSISTFTTKVVIIGVLSLILAVPALTRTEVHITLPLVFLLYTAFIVCELFFFII